MSFNCCDIPAYLSSFPETWRKELSDVLCLMYASVPDNFACETVRGCETLTEVTELSFADTTLTLKYRDEHNIVNTKTVNISGAIPSVVTADNGLTKTSNNIRIGGLLVVDTTIDLNGNDFVLTGNNIIFTTFPNSRVDASPLNFLFTTTTGQLQSANLKDSVENIANTYINNLFNVAVGNQTGCLSVNWATLTLQEKFTNLMDVIKQLCTCCDSNQDTCNFQVTAIQIS